MKIKMYPGTRSFMLAALVQSLLAAGASAGVASVVVVRSDPKLHLVLIAVDEYPDLTLEFCKADAELVARSFEEKARNTYTTVKTTKIFDSEATKDGIEQKLSEIARTLDTDTRLVLYFAGMGVTALDESGGYISGLVPSGVSLEGARVGGVSKLVTSKWLSAWASGLQSRSQLFILDTNSAGGLLPDFITSYIASSRRSLDRVDRDLSFICASSLGFNQDAFEDADVKHGRLSWVLGEALSGKADTIVPDGAITLREVECYLYARMAELSMARDAARSGRYAASALTPGELQASGIRQFPASFITASDYKLVDSQLKPDSMAESAIKLIEPSSRANIYSTRSQFTTVRVRVDPVPTSGVREVIVNGKPAHRDSDEFIAIVDLPVGQSELIVQATSFASAKQIVKFKIVREASPSELEEVKIGKAYALVIGIDTYDATEDWRPLNNPSFDATAVGDTLRTKLGYEQVQLLLNPSRDEIRAAVKEWRDRSFDRNDHFVFYFAGHGHYEPNEHSGVLVAKDSLPLSKDKHQETYVSLSWIRDSLDDMKCRHVMAIIDSCFSGTFDARIARPSDEFSGRVGLLPGADREQDVDFVSLVNAKMALPSRKYITAGGRQYVPDGRPGHHSPFTANLLKALAAVEERGVLTFARLVSEIEWTDPVPRAGAFGVDSGNGDYVFVLKKPD
ncbi:MAG: hypothetical protein AKCLJLPJ_00982 [Fimbriimonadales bacterium]|nr:hypothetical protein [Fimbriimonadales bacterium]